MTETPATTPEQSQEAQKLIHKAFNWMFKWIRQTPILLEEREDFIKAQKALQMIVGDPPENQTAEEKHEFNKSARYGLGWVHYKLGVTAHKPRNLDEAAMASGILYTICMDLQKKIEEVEPPAPKAESAPKKPYVVDVPTMQATQ